MNRPRDQNKNKPSVILFEGKQRKEEAMVTFVFGNGRVTRIRYTVDTPIIGTLKAQ